MIPTSRTEFAQFCLRKLGAPVIKVNLSEDQVDDCVDQALYFFNEYHMDGGNNTYWAHAMTADEIKAKQVKMPDNIIGVSRIFPLGTQLGSDALFNMKYQFIQNDI